MNLFAVSKPLCPGPTWFLQPADRYWQLLHSFVILLLKEHEQKTINIFLILRANNLETDEVILELPTSKITVSLGRELIHMITQCQYKIHGTNSDFVSYLLFKIIIIIIINPVLRLFTDYVTELNKKLIQRIDSHICEHAFTSNVPQLCHAAYL